MDLRVLALWGHLLAIVVWVGGIFHWALMLYVDRSTGRGKERSAWIEAVGRRVHTIGWEALGVIVITGIFNLIDRVRTGVLFQAEYLTPFFVKMGLVVGMVGIQLWQHVGVLPRVTGAARSSPAGTARRRHMLVATGILLALAAGAMWMGVRLRYQ